MTPAELRSPSERSLDALRRDLAGCLDAGSASTEPADRTAYARDMWPRQQIATRMGEARPSPPAVIVWPTSIDEVRRIVRFAATRKIPLVPYGAGSGVCGGILADPSAIVLDLKRMRAVRSIDGSRLVCDAQAGILGENFEDELASRGFTLGHFPSSIYCSTLGGWIATRSAGQCSGRYGKIEDMVLGLTCVDGHGEVRSAEEGSGDAALLPLIIGSEGTLAVITDARLRIAPQPEARRFASYRFRTIEEGLDVIRRMYQSRLRPAVARLYDPFDSLISKRSGSSKTPERKKPRSTRSSAWLAQALRAPHLLNRLVESLPKGIGKARLILMWEDADEIADAELAAAHAIAIAGGGEDTGEGPARHWLEHRHRVSYRQSPLYAAGAFVDTMEVASTWSRLLPMYEAVRAALTPHVFVMAHFSHAYPDGASIYFTFAAATRNDREALTIYDEAWRDALRAVVDAGGTFSHHHGVGRSKASAMRSEQGAGVEVLRELKRVLDPAGILNPGALLPDGGAT